MVDPPRRRRQDPGALNWYSRGDPPPGRVTLTTDMPADDPVSDDLTAKYPHVEVRLTGQDGNAFYILGRVMASLRRAGVPETEVQHYHRLATSGNYDHLLQTTLRWVTVL